MKDLERRKYGLFQEREFKCFHASKNNIERLKTPWTSTRARFLSQRRCPFLPFSGKSVRATKEKTNHLQRRQQSGC